MKPRIRFINCFCNSLEQSLKPKNYLFGVLVMLASTAAQAKSVAQQQAQESVDFFMKACVSSQAQPELINRFAQSNGFVEVTADNPRKAFLFKDAPGTLWARQTQSGSYALTSQYGGLCSVFARNADADVTQRILASWLPPKNSAFSVTTTTERKDDGMTLVVAHSISQNNQPYADWVVTTTTRANGLYQAAITYLKR